MRCFVEPSPAGGYFVRLQGEPVPVSRHDTEEEAEAAAAAYQRGLERTDTAEHVTLAGAEVVIRAGAVDHVDHEELGAFVRGERVAVASYRRDDERPHVAVVTVSTTPGWEALAEPLRRRLGERAAANGIVELVQ